MVSIFIEKREEWGSKAPPLFSFHDETFLKGKKSAKRTSSLEAIFIENRKPYPR